MAPPPDEHEAKAYYIGTPSTPLLVARTGAPWVERTQAGFHTWSEKKALRVVGNHPIKEVWEDDLALKLHGLLDSMGVDWTSTDVVRLGDCEQSCLPVILWIGINPETLSGDDGLVVASKCKELLERDGIADVDVQIRESEVRPSAGPKLLRHPSWYSHDHTEAVRGPLATTLGSPISPKAWPWIEGSGGFYISEGDNPERLLLVTARHVVLPPKYCENEPFEHTDHRHKVMTLGDVAFNEYLECVQDSIRGAKFGIVHYQTEVAELEAQDRPNGVERLKVAQANLDERVEKSEALTALFEDVTTRWVTAESRVLGHVVLSPPIDVGTGRDAYTEDWAVIEVDRSKVDASNFQGNGIYLPVGDKYSRKMSELIHNMRPEQNIGAHGGDSSFKFPHDHILKLSGTIPDEEMRGRSTARDGDDRDKPCLMVIKGSHPIRCSSSQSTEPRTSVGRANDVFSYVRRRDGRGNAQTSKEWAILPFPDADRCPFSGLGDSGSIIVDGRGRMGGMITGGTGGKLYSQQLDITYATPANFLLERMRASGLRNIDLNPVLTGSD